MGGVPTNGDPLREDFRNFLWYIWRQIGLPEPDPVQYDMAHWLQHGPDKQVIMAFRGVGKSWITSAFVCWLLYCNPTLNILVVSASKDRSDAFSTFTLRLIEEIDILQHLIPGPKDRQSKIAFDVSGAGASHAPSVKSNGILGQNTGSRADVIVADDVEVPNNSETVTEREKLLKRTKEFTDIVKPVPWKKIIYLGTPQTEESMYNSLIARGYTVRIWPAEYPSVKLQEIYGDRLAPMIQEGLDKGARVGEPVVDRFSRNILNEKLLEHGIAGYQLQYMLDTSLADADKYPLKLKDLITFFVNSERAPTDIAWGNDPRGILEDLPLVGFAGDKFYKPIMYSEHEWSKYEGIIMAVDPAGRGKDETAYAVVAQHFGRLYLLDAGGYREGYTKDVLEGLCEVAKRFKVHRIIVEPNFGDGMFSALLEPYLAKIYPCQIEETERSQNQKELRIIDALEPIMQQHKLVVGPDLVQKDFDSVRSYDPDKRDKYRLFYQLTHISRERGSLRQDDRLDALAMAVHYWRELMNRDSVKAAERHRDRLRDKEVRAFLRNNLGRKGRIRKRTFV